MDLLPAVAWTINPTSSCPVRSPRCLDKVGNRCSNFGLVSEQQVPAGESDDLEFGIRSAISRPPAFSHGPPAFSHGLSTAWKINSAHHLVERHVIWVH